MAVCLADGVRNISARQRKSNERRGFETNAECSLKPRPWRTVQLIGALDRQAPEQSNKPSCDKIDSVLRAHDADVDYTGVARRSNRPVEKEAVLRVFEFLIAA